jgi:hypothetical protein
VVAVRRRFKLEVMLRIMEFYRLVIERPVVNLNDRGMDVAKGREGLLILGGLTGSPPEPNNRMGLSIHRVTYHETLEQ